MQIRSRTYLQIISRLRALGVAKPHQGDKHAQEVSPFLVFTAVALALLLAMLEIDLHSAQLHALGLFGFPIDNPLFCGP
jgi:hypothetical protein